MVDLTKIKQFSVVDADGNWGYISWDDVATIHIDKASATGAMGHKDVNYVVRRYAAPAAPPAPPQTQTPPPPAPPPSTPAANKPAATLSGLVWNQKYPIGTNSKFPIAAGYLAPIGGVGPFTYKVTDRSGKYRARGDTLWTDEVSVGPDTDTLTAYVIDGRGDVSPPITFTVQKSAANGLGLNTHNPLPSFSPVWSGRSRADAAPIFTPGAYGPDHADTRADTITVDDKSGTWAASGGVIYGKAGTPPPGSYPARIGAKNSASGVTTYLDETLVIGPAPSISDGEFHQTGIWSDVSAPGTEIGIMCATAPDNAPVFTTAHPLLRVDPTTRKVLTLAPAPVGPVSFDVQVASGGTALTGVIHCSATVQKGTLLPATDMSLALNKLDNSTPGQKVGVLSVKGRTGGTYLIFRQSGFNPDATVGQWGNPARYQISANEVVTPPDCLLSWQDPACGWEDDQITVVWTSSDGLTVCENTFTIPVTEPAVTRIIDVTDKASLHAANVTSGSFHTGLKYWVKVHYNPDPDAYTDATRGEDTKNGWVGPVWVELVPGPNGELPRLGGKGDNTGVYSGATSYGKGYFIASHGDFRLIGHGIISGVHGGSSTSGLEGVRRDGNTYGTTALIDVAIQDNDQGFECGVIHGAVFIQRLTNRRNGGASVGAGLTHGNYVGNCSKFEMVDSYVDDVTWGHLVKSRAIQTILRRNIIADTGSAACCLDLPNGGNVLLEGNTFLKRGFATNPAAVNFGAEGPAHPVNRLVSRGNTFDLSGAISYGGNFGPIVAFMHYHLPGDAPSSITSDDDILILPPQGRIYMEDAVTFAKDGTTTINNPIILTLPPTPKLLPPLQTRPYRRRFIMDGTSEFPNFNAVPQLMSTFVFEVSAPGPVVHITPTGDIVGGADPFAAGWTRTIDTKTGVYNHSSNPTPWAPDGAFTLTTNDVLIYNGGLAPGVYLVQTQFTSTDGKTVSNGRIPVTVR